MTKTVPIEPSANDRTAGVWGKMSPPTYFEHPCPAGTATFRYELADDVGAPLRVECVSVDGTKIGEYEVEPAPYVMLTDNVPAVS